MPAERTAEAAASDNQSYPPAGWGPLDADARRIAALGALARRDAAALCALADAYLTLYGPHRSRTSDHTRRAYRTGIALLLAAWAGEDLAAPRRDAAALWLEALERGGASTSTVRVRMAAGRLLYRALRWAGAVQIDPFADVRAAPDPTPAWEKRQPYPEADIAKLLAAADPLGRVIVLLGAHAGLRVSEMCALIGSDTTGDITVRHGKGGKQRRVAVSRSLQEALAGLPNGLPNGLHGPLLGGLDPDGVRARLEALCGRAGVAYRGVHALRHSAGTRLYQATSDLQTVARHLGHSSIATSAIYAKYADQRTRSIMDAW